MLYNKNDYAVFLCKINDLQKEEEEELIIIKLYKFTEIKFVEEKLYII